MAKDATLQVRLDAQLKDRADEVFHRSGLTFSEAVRRFVKASVDCDSVALPDIDAPVKREALYHPETANEERVSGFGMFSSYADERKRAREKDAWKIAAARKHATVGGEAL